MSGIRCGEGHGSTSKDRNSFPLSPPASLRVNSKAIVESVLTHSFMDIPGKFMSMLDRSDDHTVVRKNICWPGSTVHAHCFPKSNKVRASVPDKLFLRDAPCEITIHRKHWPLKGCCFGGSVSEGPLCRLLYSSDLLQSSTFMGCLSCSPTLPGPVSMLSLRRGVNIGSGRFLSRCAFY